MVPWRAPVSLMALHCYEARDVWLLHLTWHLPLSPAPCGCEQLSAPFLSEGLGLSPRDPSEIPSLLCSSLGPGHSGELSCHSLL